MSGIFQAYHLIDERTVYENIETPLLYKGVSGSQRKSMVAEIDPKKLTVEAKWPLNPGEEPTGLAMDRKNRRLFSGCANKLMVVMDADNGHVSQAFVTQP